MDDKAPWWSEGRKLIWSLGPVTVSFFLLLAVMLGWLPSPLMALLTDNLTLGKANNTISLDIRTGGDRHRLEMAENQKMISRGLRLICRNTAKDQPSRDLCDDLE